MFMMFFFLKAFYFKSSISSLFYTHDSIILSACLCMHVFAIIKEIYATKAKVVNYLITIVHVRPYM